MKKLIGMALAALFTVTAAESVSAQDYHKYEKKYEKHDFDRRGDDFDRRGWHDNHYYDRHPHGNAWGYRERVDVINPRPYYGFRRTWDGRTILIDGRRYNIDDRGRYFYNGRYYYYHR